MRHGRQLAPTSTVTIILGAVAACCAAAALTLQAQGPATEPAHVRVVFEIRGKDGGKWTALATDRKAPFRQSVSLAKREPGTYQVRAVAIGKGGKRTVSAPVEIVVPEPNTDKKSDATACGVSGGAKADGQNGENVPDAATLDSTSGDQKNQKERHGKHHKERRHQGSQARHAH